MHFYRLTIVLIICLSFNLYSQSEITVSEADYARAESFLSPNTSALVDGNIAAPPKWLPDGRLLYKRTIPGGSEYIVADPKTKSRRPAFDHQKLAEALSAMMPMPLTAANLPIFSLEFSADGQSIKILVPPGQYLSCDLQNYQISTVNDGFSFRTHLRSPDGKKAAFIRDYNLWLLDLASGEERQLTSDGQEDFGYATNNAGWIKMDRPVLLWSPDSKKIATFQHDGRGVGEMYLVNTAVGHSELQAWKYPLPGDSLIFRVQRVIIHLDEEKPRLVRLQMPPDMHRSTISDHIADWDGTLLDAEWLEDGKKLAFVSSSRDHKTATLRIADSESGAVRTVLSETAETFFESGYDLVNWHVLPESNEVIWYSQRDNWGHLYLYDLRSGKLKRQITKGDWNVLQLLHIDRKKRRLYFTGSCKEAGDPYFHYLYSVGINGRGLKRLTKETAHHTISFSPSGKYFYNAWSTPSTAPVFQIRNRDGSTKMALEKADISRLQESGWVPPISITVKARDGKTDLYGLMYKPTNFDAGKSYPVLNYIYPGPQSGSVGSRSFRPSRSDKQALAELGFVVVEIDAMGTPGRSKSFHAAYYGNMGDNGLPDQIAAIRELAGRHSWMDIDRVGIWGHSGGGFASTAGILRYPDFYKVAVSGAGNHDNRNYEDDWAEKWQGLLKYNADGSSNYDNQANQLQAKNLKGKLLIAHGTLDSNVPPYNTLLVVDALIEANKDFDLIMFPNRGHGFGSEPYWMRKRWDYFVRHLLGVEPPKEYKIKTVMRRRRPL